MPADRDSFELLRSLVRQPPDAAVGMKELAEKVDDWDPLLSLAQEHRVTTLLYRRLPELGETVPLQIQEKLRADYSRNILQNLANAAELIQILKEFERRSILAMPFKGVVLAASVYGDLAARPAGDIDVLIYYRDLVKATRLLLERGYELTTAANPDGSPAFADYFEYHFERQTDGMVVELRWRLELLQPRHERDLAMDWVWPGRRSAMLAGAEVPDMSPEVTLIVLCMHGSKHLWSRLIWICDVAQLLAARPRLDWKETIRQAGRYGLWRPLALGVLLAARIAGTEVPVAVSRRFEANSTVSGLVRHFDENLSDAPGSLPVSRLPYNIQLLGFRDRARLLLSPAWWRPSERDIEAFPLPKPLYPLYSLIRPIRILLDRTPRF
jgi:hypothetical protein